MQLSTTMQEITVQTKCHFNKKKIFTDFNEQWTLSFTKQVHMAITWIVTLPETGLLKPTYREICSLKTKQYHLQSPVSVNEVAMAVNRKCNLPSGFFWEPVIQDAAHGCHPNTSESTLHPTVFYFRPSENSYLEHTAHIATTDVTILNINFLNVSRAYLHISTIVGN